MPKIIEGLEKKLVEIAEQLFMTEGYDAVNIRKIAGEAHIAAGTVYNYFPSKEALYQAVLISSWDKTLRRLEDIVHEEGAIWHEQVKAFVKTVYMEVENRKGLGGRVILEEKKKKSASGTEVKIDSYLNQIHIMFKALLEEQPSISRSDDDLERLSKIILGSFWILHRNFRGDIKKNLAFMDMYLESLLGMEE